MNPPPKKREDPPHESRADPTLPVLDRRFVYVPASHTDIRERFKRIEAERRPPVENVKSIQWRAR
jgi:hypothetical protein